MALEVLGMEKVRERGFCMATLERGKALAF